MYTKLHIEYCIYPFCYQYNNLYLHIYFIFIELNNNNEISCKNILKKKYLFYKNLCFVLMRIKIIIKIFKTSICFIFIAHF